MLTIWLTTETRFARKHETFVTLYIESRSDPPPPLHFQFSNKKCIKNNYSTSFKFSPANYHYSSQKISKYIPVAHANKIWPFCIRQVKLRKEMGNVSKRQQPDHRADNSRRPPMGIQCSEKLQYP